MGIRDAIVELVKTVVLRVLNSVGKDGYVRYEQLLEEVSKVLREHGIEIGRDKLAFYLSDAIVRLEDEGKVVFDSVYGLVIPKH